MIYQEPNSIIKHARIFQLFLHLNTEIDFKIHSNKIIVNEGRFRRFWNWSYETDEKFKSFFEHK